MSAPIAFPYDDPAWEGATDAFLKTDTRDLLQELTELWNDETADYLFFSSLLHQDTVYPATFLALPHVAALAPVAPDEARGMIALFLGGVALHAHLPRTSGGVSLAAGDPFAATELGQRAAQALDDCLPGIAELNEAAYRDNRNHYYASGLAAAEGCISLALWLMTGENGGFQCPACDADCEWLLFGDDLAVYPGQFSLEDWKAGHPETAASIAATNPEPSEVAALRTRLGPTDPTTNALLRNYHATVTCPSCGWQGVMQDPRLA